MPKVSLIVAVAQNGVIGKDNDLPWKLSADLKYFKRLTSGHSIIMGRNTYESIGRPLPNRRNIVVSRQADYAAEGIEVVHSLEAAIALCEAEKELFIIGGAQLYSQAFDRADTFYITRVLADIEGDTFFPEWCTSEFLLHSTIEGKADEKNQYDYCFETWVRKKS